jgi:hypothetical protein
MDYFIGEYVVAEDLKPIWTIWKHTTVVKDIKAAKRRARRTYKQYLRTGDIRQFNKSQRKITRWDFD